MKTHIKIIYIITLLFVYNNCFSQNWTLQHQDVMSRTITDMQFINNQTGWVSGVISAFVRTTNGGTTWTRYDISQGYDQINSFYFLNGNTGFAVGSFTPNKRLLVKTTNGGINWNIHKEIGKFGTYWGSELHSLRFVNANTGFFIDKDSIRSRIFKTTNAGISWDSQIVQQKIPSILYINEYTWYIYSDLYGPDITNLYKTTNGGVTFDSIFTSPKKIWDVSFANLNTGWCLERNEISNYKLFKTTSSGNLWTEIPVSGIPNFDAITLCIINESKCFIGGFDLTTNKSLISMTSNSGESWSYWSFNTNQHIWKFSFPSSNTGWTTNARGMIWKYSEPVNIQFNNTFVDNYSLSQNYPNPFNPETNIEFSIPIKQYVKLVIYNALGKEIETIVNEELSNGSYNVKWNALQYPSGIYFYKLETSDFSHTKKMLIIK